MKKIQKTNININDYLIGHIKNIQLYIKLILKLLNSSDLHIKENYLIYESFIDSVSINVYWISEIKKVKSIKKTKNVDNPFYIWCKFFDSLKHPDRQISIANKIFKVINQNLKMDSKSNFTITSLGDFVQNLKTDDENTHIENKTFFDLYIKFIHPRFIEFNYSSSYLCKNPYIVTKSFAIIFWKTMFDFFGFLINNTIINWDNIWYKFINQYSQKDDIIFVWKYYKKLFNLS